MMDFSMDNMLAAGGVFLSSVGSAVGLARREVRIVADKAVDAAMDKHSKDHYVILSAISSLDGRADDIQRDVAFIRGWIDGKKEK